MKINEIFQDLNEAKDDPLHHKIKYTMPHSVVIPGMDEYYQYYRFATAMASHPEADNSHANFTNFRDEPIAIAYTPEEMDMIMTTARKLGFNPKDVAFPTSKEAPGINTVSPVMKFNMFESQTESMRNIMEKLS